MPTEIMVVTTPQAPGYRVTKVLGIVHGMTARTRGIGGKILGGLQSLVGGEVKAFTEELEKAKDEALERLKANAQQLGANGVIGAEFETTEVFDTVVLLSAHGTAVILEKE
ncbi:MAG: YbjQ family protein [Thaumarchaeota archaeon]|nr:YbjQ family protein [Nitrososphaerota archaeon]